jgi:hypothetical protein
MEQKEFSKILRLDLLMELVGMRDTEVMTDGVVIAPIRRMERGRTE